MKRARTRWIAQPVPMIAGLVLFAAGAIASASELPLSPTGKPQTVTTVGPSGKGLLTAWLERDSHGISRLKVARVEDGKISSPQELDYGSIWALQITAGVNESLVTWSLSHWGVMGQRIGLDGMPIGSPIEVPGAGQHDVLWTGEGYFIAYQSREGPDDFPSIYGRLIHDSSVGPEIRLVESPTVPAGWFAEESAPRLATNGTTMALAYVSGERARLCIPGNCASNWNLVVAALDLRGSPLRHQTSVPHTHNGLHDISSDGAGFALLSGPHVSVTRLGAHLERIDSSPIELFINSSGAQAGIVGLDGAYDVVWSYLGWLTVMRIDAWSIPITTSHTRLPRPLNDLSISAVDGAHVVVYSRMVPDENLDLVSRAFLNSLDDLSPAPSRPPAPHLLRVYRKGRHTIIESGASEGAEGYVVESSEDGARFRAWQTEVPSEEIVFEVGWWPLDAQFRVRAWNAAGLSEPSMPMSPEPMQRPGREPR